MRQLICKCLGETITNLIDAECDGKEAIEIYRCPVCRTDYELIEVFEENELDGFLLKGSA